MHLWRTDAAIVVRGAPDKQCRNQACRAPGSSHREAYGCPCGARLDMPPLGDAPLLRVARANAAIVVGGAPDRTVP
jgi:hypothetical protein